MSLAMSRRKRYTRNLGRKLPSPQPVRTTVEWVRFENAHEPFGVFTYLSQARRRLSAGRCAKSEGLSRWFGENLGSPKEAEALTEERFWFRAEAREHVEKARELARLVSRTGYSIVERRIRRVPGKVTWEDEHQVAALTYRDAPQAKRRA
jgi:hypothetical protein